MVAATLTPNLTLTPNESASSNIEQGNTVLTQIEERAINQSNRNFITTASPWIGPMERASPSLCGPRGTAALSGLRGCMGENDQSHSQVGTCASVTSASPYTINNIVQHKNSVRAREIGTHPRSHQKRIVHICASATYWCESLLAPARCVQ